MTKTILFSLLVGILGFAAGYLFRGQLTTSPASVEPSLEIPAIEIETRKLAVKEKEAFEKLPEDEPKEQTTEEDVTLFGVLSSSPYGQSLRRGVESQFRQRYAPFLSSLNYTQAQSDEFIQLITNMAIDWIDRQDALNKLPVDFDLELERGLSIRLRHAKFRKQMWDRWYQEIESFLQEDYVQFSEFQKTVWERDQLRRLTHQMEDSLDEYTREQLVAILIEENTFADVPEQQLLLFGETEIQYHRDRHDALTRRDQGFLERASDYLTPDQLEALGRAVEREKGSRERSIERLQHPRFGQRY